MRHHFFSIVCSWDLPNNNYGLRLLPITQIKYHYDQM